MKNVSPTKCMTSFNNVISVLITVFFCYFATHYSQLLKTISSAINISQLLFILKVPFSRYLLLLIFLLSAIIQMSTTFGPYSHTEAETPILARKPIYRKQVFKGLTLSCMTRGSMGLLGHCQRYVLSLCSSGYSVFTVHTKKRQSTVHK